MVDVIRICIQFTVMTELSKTAMKYLLAASFGEMVLVTSYKALYIFLYRMAPNLRFVWPFNNEEIIIIINLQLLSSFTKDKTLYYIFTY